MKKLNLILILISFLILSSCSTTHNVTSKNVKKHTKEARFKAIKKHKASEYYFNRTKCLR